MNNDVIDSRPVNYVHARLPGHGMIQIKGRFRDLTFHRDNTLDRWPEAEIFETMEDAIFNLPEDIEAFVMSFPEGDVAERMWFSREQKEAGIVDRLDIWHQCYGEYKRSIY